MVRATCCYGDHLQFAVWSQIASVGIAEWYGCGSRVRPVARIGIPFDTTDRIRMLTVVFSSH